MILSFWNFFICTSVYLSSYTVLAALPTCAPGVTCPPGGLWSEWSTSSTETCDSPCGACGKQKQTRTCTSSSANCQCTGPTSRDIPCNLETCKYPAQRTCCIPYVPMLVNGSMSCGPLPKTMTSGTGSACCPVGGLWADWTGYRKASTTGWVRNRMCISEQNGCPCTGDREQTMNTCPCPSPGNANDCTSINNTRPFQKVAMKIDHQTCTGSLEMVGNNNDFLFCHKWTNYYRYYDWVALLLMKDEKGECSKDIVFDCRNGERSDLWMSTSFTCDTTSLNWIYDWSGKQVTAYNQGVYISLT